MFSDLRSPLTYAWGMIAFVFGRNAAFGESLQSNGDVIPYVYSLQASDYYVIGGYLLFLCSIGFILKRLCRDSRDYLIGGNKIPWWLAGASIFMMSFSAWTFTGAAGFAYEYGIRVILILYFSMASYIIAGLWLAARTRQTRCMTFGQIIHGRFGRLGEQFFVWIQFPSMLFSGAVWLLGLAIFISIPFGIPIPVTILVTGAIVLLYSTLSGSWAVMTTDFIQSIILMTLSVIIAVLTLVETGGPTQLFQNMRPENLEITGPDHSWLWMVAYCVQILVMFSSVQGANRYLAVRDGLCAKKAAFLAAALFVAGPLIWFIPPFAASFLFPDLAAMLPGLEHPADGSYMVMALNLLPAGLAGLLIMVIFAATLSSMDTAINVNAGILAMNIYKPLFRPEASEHELFVASRVFNFLCGIAVIAAAYVMARLGSLNLFDLLLLFSSGFALPVAVPCVLLFIFRKTPNWPAVVSVVLGTTYSIVGLMLDWDLFPRVFGVLGIGLVTFLIARLFWSRFPANNQQRVLEFYTTMERPVDASKEVVGSEDLSHLSLVGRLLCWIGGGLLLLVLFPNSLSGRLICGITALVVISIGAGFRRLGSKSQ